MAAQNGAQLQPKISPGQSLHRSISTPAPTTSSVRIAQQQQPVQMSSMAEHSQQQRSGSLAVAGNPHHRGLIRSMSRTEAVKE